MNHDITHCYGCEIHIADGSKKIVETDRVCPVRESCYRYIAHLDPPDPETPYRSYLINQKITPEGCHRYWPEEDKDING